MNKQVLRTYLNKASKNDLKTSCFKCDDYYLISDSYSLIKLNNNYDLDIKDDKYNFNKMLDNFKSNFDTYYTFDKIEPNDNYYVPIDDNYGINTKLYNRIKKIIKANVLSSVLENKNKNDYMKYIIKLENDKTNEVAYMLPMKKY